ncbi:MAG: polysaccharide biosynthesis tyrosine autokinase [Microscillaceae bacterium]|jgi:capsular exopolysaccharide synthesis family protein|nr:polysaccharide biosynthesis tyrosine autokinase [Microscillaceae bacterium]
MSRILKNDSINLGLLFFRLGKYWYILVASLGLALGWAYYTISKSEKVYGFKAALMLNPRRTGLDEPDALLLNVDHKLDRNISTKDKIGVITSFDMIRRIIHKLDFGVSYYVGNKPNPINERYGKFPFRIKLDSVGKSVVEVPLKVEIVSAKEVRISGSGEDVMLYDYAKQEIVDQKIPKLKYQNKIEVKKPYKDNRLALTVIPNEGFAKSVGKSYTIVINNPTALTRAYQAKIKAEPAERDSYILNIRSEGTIADKEIAFLNKLMDVVIEDDFNEKTFQAQKTLSHISKRLQETEDSLARSESNVQALQTEKTSTDFDYLYKKSTENLNNLSDQKNILEQKLDGYNNALNFLQNNAGWTNPINFSVSDQTVNTLINTLSDLSRAKAARLLSETEASPAVSRLNTQIDAARRDLNSYLANNIQATRSQLRRVITDYNNALRLQGQIPSSSRALGDFQRQADLSQDLYKNYYAKKDAAIIGLEISTPDIKVIEQARKEKSAPIKPNSQFIYLIAVIVGVFIPIGFIVVQDSFNDTLVYKSDIAEATKLPLLVMVPKAPKKNQLTVINHPYSATTEGFRNVMLSLNQILEPTALTDNNHLYHQGKMIGLTSTINLEGKTYCSANLAAIYALAGKKTLLLGADLYKPNSGLGVYFTSSKVGLADYLSKNASMDEIIQHTSIENLDIIAGGQPIANSPLLLNGLKMENLVRVLKDTYDYIIVDIPPIGFVSDYLTLKNSLDITLYVARFNYTRKKLLVDINEAYEAGKVKNIYLLLNRVNFSEMQEYLYKNRKNDYYKQNKKSSIFNQESPNPTESIVKNEPKLEDKPS